MRAIGMISSLTRGNSGKQPSHLHHGGVEKVEKELGRDADDEHQKCDRNYHPLLVRSEIGKSDTGVNERTAKKRLHYAHKHDGGEEESMRCKRHTLGRNRQGTS